MRASNRFDTGAALCLAGVQGAESGWVKRKISSGLLAWRAAGACTIKPNRLADLFSEVPWLDTPRSQKAHITLGSIYCDLVERHLLPSPQQAAWGLRL